MPANPTTTAKCKHMSAFGWSFCPDCGEASLAVVEQILTDKWLKKCGKSHFGRMSNPQHSRYCPECGELLK